MRRTGMLAVLLIFVGTAAEAVEWSMNCENPRRSYAAIYNPIAKTFRVETAGEVTQYQVHETRTVVSGFIVSGMTLDGGPDFRAYVTAFPKIDFLVNGEITQTDKCERN